MAESTNSIEGKQKFHLYEHPWLAMLALIATTFVSIGLSGTLFFNVLKLPDDSPVVYFLQQVFFHCLTVFVIAPFLLHLPKGKKPFAGYLADIGLRKWQPFFRLLILAISCYLIQALSQALASLFFRYSEGLPISFKFIGNIFTLTDDLPPKSWGVLTTIPSMLEEIAFRGILLTVFLGKYSDRKAVIFSSIGFGLMHLVNLIEGVSLMRAAGQMVWTFIIGLFYGYVFLKTRSLVPSMIVHYLGNVFFWSLTGYLQIRAVEEVQILYSIIFTSGIVPTTLMILWARFLIPKLSLQET